MILLSVLFLGAALALVPVAGAAETPPVDPAHLIGCQPDARVAEQDAFVSFGGIEQWVTVRGTDCANPVILFVHGGPGNPLTPFADAVYGSWTSDFTLVQWDQRGAGRTWERNPQTADSELTLEQMTADGTELALLLAQVFDQPKVILLGGSWGSMLGVEMVRARPDLYHAWIGAGQMVSYQENEAIGYQSLKGLAETAGDADTLSKLEAMGPPPWENPRNFGAFRRLTRRYEARATIPAPVDWWAPAAAYATPEYEAAYEGGEDYSYLAFVGLNGDGILSGLDQFARSLEFQIPIYLIQGAEDLVTVPSETRRFFDALTAPDKAYVLVPTAGHDPNAAIIAAEHRILMERILPVIRGHQPAP